MLVMIYAYCILLYNNWKVRRYAAIEAREKEEEAELYPMLKMDDVPFGARALKRGVYVEGIWAANHNTPSPSPRFVGTPIESRSSSPMLRPIPVRPASLTSSMTHETILRTPTPGPPVMRPPIQSEVDLVTANHYTYEPYNPGAIYKPVVASSAPTSSNSSRVFHRRSGIPPRNEKRASFHTRILRSSQIFDNKSSHVDPSDSDEMEMDIAARKLDSQSPAEQNRASRLHSE